ncbi:hypothetical protein [Hymenobacter actinosclerus]|uniref:Uncharacterized protein n=1 Tax=Hymenobacter actinosclerus TaxID=82805 RepID=A0A1I0IZ40_9BACT|nr:hypothetical protein [Hymenobacter actinosclerus]SEU02632.1 hypothetical protein SAMN04487998_3549 [Hymenobacter actinosclerus]
MRGLFLLLLLSVTLLPGRHCQAQPTPTAPKPSTQSATDVILRTNGDELPGRVVRITPRLVRYLPSPAPTDSLAPVAATDTDTLELAAAEVFMIRYANGTREVMRPAVPAPASGTSLQGLSAAQRTELGRQDSRKYYKPDKGVFWGTFGATLVGSGYGGIVAGSVMGLSAPPRRNLDAPQPDLLNDLAYYDGYRRQAQSKKLGKAAAGFGTGVGVGIVILLILLSNTTHF